MAQALHSERAMEISSQKNLSQQTMSQLKGCATAILFLRLFIGGVMLLHIIGKMQTYDNLVLEAKLTDEQREKIFWKNTADLFGEGF